MTETLARTVDPTESQDAAKKISAAVKRDRLTMLRAFDYLGRATHREASARAQIIEGSTGMIRLETFRKRGSDLKLNGLIVQVGRHDGQAEFILTSAGQTALLAS